MLKFKRKFWRLKVNNHIIFCKQFCKEINHTLISSVSCTFVFCYFSCLSTDFPPYFLLQWKRHCCRCFVKPGCYLGAVYHDSLCDVARPLASTTWHNHQWGAKIMETLMMMVLYWSPYWLTIREWGRGALKQPNSCNWCYVSLLVSAQRVERNIRRLHKNIVLAIKFLLPLVINIIL